MKSHRNLLLAGALLGAAAGAAACDPKQIGNETAGNVVCEDGATKPADDGCNTCTCNDGQWACTEIACEECIEGATKPAGDGCNTCVCADGNWACTLLACEATDGPTGTCGDGVVEGPEECDDGNVVDGDGCSADCLDEDVGGTTGTGGDEPVGSTSGPVGECGNGVLEPLEQCDDGNLLDGDGCTSNCQIPGGGGVVACPAQAPFDPFDIVDATIVVDTLSVGVEFGGGCETHDFQYCWDGAFAESDPVQIWTKISHEDHGDACEALVSKSLEFDLTDLKTAYQQSYQEQNGEITIHLDGWPMSLSYTF